jgi:Tol biopolymer transport system component
MLLPRSVRTFLPAILLGVSACSAPEAPATPVPVATATLAPDPARHAPPSPVPSATALPTVSPTSTPVPQILGYRSDTADGPEFVLLDPASQISMTLTGDTVPYAISANGANWVGIRYRSTEAEYSYQVFTTTFDAALRAPPVWRAAGGQVSRPLKVPLNLVAGWWDEAWTLLAVDTGVGLRLAQPNQMAGENGSYIAAGFVPLYRASLSRDRRWIAAFGSDVRTAETGLFLIDAKSGERRRVAPFTSPNYNELYVAWSPDSSTLAIHAYEPGESPPNYDIYVIDVRDGQPLRITSDPASDRAAVWSPDSAQIAFVSERSGRASVWVMDADGANARDLVRSPELACDVPAWSPDGDWIAMACVAPGRATDLYLVRPDGSALIQVTAGSATESWPMWIPAAR